MSAYVYRAWDEADRLLYIGCTGNPGARMAKHRLRSAWYPFAADLALEAHPDRNAALIAEERAVATEHSHFNVTVEEANRIRRSRTRGDRDTQRGPARRLNAYLAIREGGAS